MFNLKEHPHRRRNALTGEWVLVSPHRTKRPWQGQVEKLPPAGLPPYDPHCYLCPGNSRAGGHRNPDYHEIFVFDNDFAALLPDTPAGSIAPHPLLQAESITGICRVVCFSPRHDLTLARMGIASIAAVVGAWIAQYEELMQREDIRYVQIFENRGEMMGCSNPHPHGQIWASSSLPNEIVKEQHAQEEHFSRHGRSLLSDYLKAEESAGERIVCRNETWTCLTPWWAVWPFETMLISRRHVTGMDELSADEATGLAAILQDLATRYDNLFEISFPYSGGFHQRPAGIRNQAWHLHAHFYPPLLRSATVRKFLVGYEMLAMPQRDITPEFAAHRLRQALPASSETPAG